ncbi:MAG: metallopeptidase TldD-related protein [Myxococcota bacterium]
MAPLAAIALAALAAEPQPAAAVDLPWADVLDAELQRNFEALALPEAPPIYHLRYHLLQLGQVDVHAALGSLVEADTGRFNLFAAEVRVGDPHFDNSGFGGWQDGFLRGSLPQELTAEALATEAWRTTDAAYKQAVEQYARKVSQFVPPPDYPGDYTLTGAVVADAGEGTAEASADRLAELAVALTGAMEGEPALLRGEVFVGHEAGSQLTVDSEGTRVRTPVAETTIRAVVAARAEDGLLVTDQRLWTVHTPDDLPPREQMLQAVRALRDDVVAAAAAPALDDEYVGPVVFEGQAALDLQRYVLTPQLEGTPPDIPFDSFFGELGDDRDPVRVGRRVLPPGWDVTDDPQAWPAHPGAYAYDNEGTPAQAVDLVQDGIVRSLAMSRVPRRGLDQTNGHARGLVGSRGAGRVTMLSVTPDRTRSEAKLLRQAARVARSYGRDWFLVVRRLQEPAAINLETDLYADGLALPPPLEVVRRHADGREERLRGAQFAGIERWILRDVMAAGPERQGDYFAPLSGTNVFGLGPTEGIPCHIRGPELLVGEVELVPAPGDPRAVPVLTPPVATR